MLLFVFFFLMPYGVDGKVWRVDNLNNGGAGSLRDHVENNANAGDTVWVDVAGTVQLQAAIQVNTPVVILGPSPVHFTLDGNNATRILEVDHAGEKSRVQGLKMVNGYAGGGDGGAVSLVDGTLTLHQCVIEDSESAFNGGAIENNGALRLMNSTIMNCYSASSGGAIYSAAFDGSVHVVNSTLAMNDADTDGGAIMSSYDSVKIHHSTIAYNSATTEGGGWASLSTDPAAHRMSNSIFEGNTSSNSPNVFSDDSINSLGGLLIPDTTGAKIKDHANNLFGTSYTSGIPNSTDYKVNGHGFKYYPLPSSSDAIDMGSLNPATRFDNRFAPRALDGNENGVVKSDIGAVEYTPYTVDDLDGSTTGNSLEWAIEDININGSAPPFYVEFDLDTSTYATLNIPQASAYQIDKKTIVDGWSQEGSRVPGPNDPGSGDQVTPGKPLVIVDGGGGAFDGFSFNSGSSGSLIRGLSLVDRMDAVGIRIIDDSVTVTGMHIGVGVDGINGTANGEHGILIQGGSYMNRIGGWRHFQRNVLGMDHNVAHVGMEDGTVLVNFRNNLILGNFMGVDATGTAATQANAPTALSISSDRNLIGEDLFASSNVIGGCDRGILLAGSSDPARRNALQFNRVGTDYDGGSPISNNQYGIQVGEWWGGAQANRIAWNQLSGNDWGGILLKENVDTTLIIGNLIGTDASGTSSLSNGSGVEVRNDCDHTFIGGRVHSDSSNVISGNLDHGIALEGGDTTMVLGNLVGTDPNGMAPVPNGNEGIRVDSMAIIGGQRDKYRNIISGNDGNGIGVVNVGYPQPLIRGNYIGVDSSGQNIMGNAGNGVHLDHASWEVVVGDTIPGFGNVIGGNQSHGILVENDPGVGIHKVGNNFIGVDSTGTVALGNSGAGVVVNSDSTYIGSPPSYGNHIAYNQMEGIRVDSNRVGNFFSMNKIHDNGGLGIDLASDGVTDNDSADQDTGPNDLTNYPELLGFSQCGGQSTIKFVLHGEVNQAYRIEFFRIPGGSGDPSGHGEGNEFLFSENVVMGGNTPDTFEVTTASLPMNPSDSLTATATHGGSESTSEFSANIAAPDSLQLLMDSLQRVTCAGDSNGAAYLSVVGGIPPYQVDWFDSIYTGLPYNDTVVTGLPGGIYNVVLTDGIGCEDTLQLTIDEPDTLKTAVDTVMHETCSGACDGSIIATYSGGTGPYTVQWDSAETGVYLYGDTIDGLCPGNYPHELIDSNGCVDSAAVGQVDPGGALMVDAGPGDTVCSGDTVTLGGSPTTNSGNASFDWSPGIEMDDSTVANPQAFPSDTTQFIVSVTDTVAGCSNTDTVRVDVLPSVVANAGTDTTICEGDTVQFNASATGGTPSYSYQWPAGGYLSSAFIPDPMASAPDTTDFILEVIDANNCTDMDTVTLNVVQTPDLQVSGQDSICSGDSSVLKASGAANYSWNTGSTSDSIVVSPPSDSTYSVTGTDASGLCSKDTSMMLRVFSPNVTMNGPTNVCEGDSVQYQASGAQNYVWSDGALGSMNETAFDSSQYYWVGGTDSAGCSDHDTLYVTVSSTPPAPTSTVTEFALCQGDPLPTLGVAPDSSYLNIWYTQAGPADSIAVGDSLSGLTFSGDSVYRYAALTDTSTGCQGPPLPFLITRFDSSRVQVSGDTAICSGGSAELQASGADSYSWSPAEGLDDPNIASPNATPTASTVFRLSAEDANGCVVEDSVQVELLSEKECDLRVYNAFSPDGDGNNDEWIIDGIQGYSENTVTIFNRWGDVVNRFEGYDNDERVWGGRNEQGRMLPAGTYYYVIRLEGERREELNGYVQITK